MAPRVSIIVTCYGQGRFVDECLDAIRDQTHRDWELVVIDDASPDDTASVVRRWLAENPVDGRLLVNDVNIGLTASLNRALADCRGEYVAYCGGDDVWHADKLAAQVPVLDEAGATTAMVYTDARWIDADGAELEPSQRQTQGRDRGPCGDIFAELIRGNFITASTVLYRRDAIDAVGGWDPELLFEDWDMFLRLAEHYEVASIDRVLVDYRVHPTSLGRRRVSPMIECRLMLLSKWLGHDEDSDAVLYPFLQEQSWRLFKVHPDMGRAHVAVAYAPRTDPTGRARRLVATSRVAEAGFEVLRRVTRPFRRTEPRPRPA